MQRLKAPSGDVSLIVLIAANLLPVAGVLVWDWSIFEIVVLYWFENVVIGAFNILKILICSPDPESDSQSSTKRDQMPDYLRPTSASRSLQHAGKLFLIPFFTFHYGMFCFVHGVFVVALLGGEGGKSMSSGDPFTGMAEMLAGLAGSGAVWFVLAIIGSHLFSFVTNYIAKGEYRRITPPELMAAPYGRIVVLHIAIIFGAFAVEAMGSPVFLLILLIVGKIIVDVKLHQRSHRKIAAKSPADE